MSRYVVETRNLTKRYGDVIAVADLNLKVSEGEIFGFLGPNGAGKTTTILMLLGLTEPTSGEVRVCGFNPAREPLKVKRVVGYLPENVGFYTDLTAWQNLRYIARLNGMPRKEAEAKISEVLDAVGLAGVAHHKVETFSRGMKQRLGLAEVLLKDPRVVILDEPTAGIDPEGAAQILEMIQALSRERRMTVFISSHLLHQVQKVCHRVGILVRGKLIAEGPVDQLGRKIRGGGLTVELEASPLSSGLMEAVRRIEGVTEVAREDDRLLITCARDLRPEIAKAVMESGCALRQLRLEQYILEEIYLRYFREA